MVRIRDATVLFILALAVTSPIIGLPSSTSGASNSGAYFNYLVVILLENRAINQTYGSKCTGNCTYITQLANQYGLAEGYSALIHNSLPNYLALTSGWTQKLSGTSGDCSPWQFSSRYCPNVNPQLTAFPFQAPNIVDRIESGGLTWKAYMEDYPTYCGFQNATYCSSGNCYLGFGGVSGEYDMEHDPFVYYAAITNSTSRCARLVPANSGTGFPDDRFIDDLSSITTASNLMWLTPNLCDDGHDNCSTLDNATSQQNQYLSEVVPQILGSNIFTTQRAALFITYDEGQTVYPRDFVTTILAGPVVRTQYKSSAQYSHYSLLKTIETNWGLQPFNQTTDGQATPMSEFFIPPLPPTNGWPFNSTLVLVAIAAAIVVIAVVILRLRTRASNRHASNSTSSQSG
jgi:phosphatidylinositol-3-phosphatase